jgi:hypothetical protein
MTPLQTPRSRARTGSQTRQLLLALVLGLTLGLTPLSGSAQTQQTELSSLEISLWPEFDRPDMLVIYRGLFTTDTSLETPVEFRIPASAGQPTAVAYVGEGGQRFNQPYTTRLEGDWLVVSFEPSSIGFQLEYYAPLPLDPDGGREFTFTYTADYATGSLNLDVQAPPGSEGFALEPAADTITQQADGLTYHLVQAGPLSAGESRSWLLTYQRTRSDLTFESLVEAETPAETAPPAAEAADSSNVVIFVIAFLALLAVGGGAFWLGRHTQPAPEPAQQPSRRRRKGASARPSKPLDGEPIFCHQCGAQARYDSVFCHKCGATLRKT